jgi:hypothetical protein
MEGLKNTEKRQAVEAVSELRTLRAWRMSEAFVPAVATAFLSNMRSKEGRWNSWNDMRVRIDRYDWGKHGTSRSRAGLSNAAPVIYYPGALIYSASFNVNQNIKKKNISE